MRAGRRLLVQRHVDDALDRRRRQRRLAAGTGGVALETCRAARNVALAPSINGSFGLADRTNSRRDPGSLRPQQNDPRPPNQLLRRIPARHPAFQPRPILSR